MTTLTRNVPIKPGDAAFLVIDVQNFGCRRDGGEYKALSPDELESEHGYYFSTLEEHVLPNIMRVQAACRTNGVEVLFTVIENLTQDGRDRSLDYKITGFNVPKGSWDAEVVSSVAPVGDEIVLPKSSSNVFMSTMIDYVLRNLGVRQLILAGVVTDQCVESAVRDAADLGYLVTLVTDACTTGSPERHKASLSSIRGYCRQVTTEQLETELNR